MRAQPQNSLSRRAQKTLLVGLPGPIPLLIFTARRFRARWQCMGTTNSRGTELLQDIQFAPSCNYATFALTVISLSSSFSSCWSATTPYLLEVNRIPYALIVILLVSGWASRTEHSSFWWTCISPVMLSQLIFPNRSPFMAWGNHHCQIPTHLNLEMSMNVLMLWNNWSLWEQQLNKHTDWFCQTRTSQALVGRVCISGTNGLIPGQVVLLKDNLCSPNRTICSTQWLLNRWIHYNYSQSSSLSNCSCRARAISSSKAVLSTKIRHQNEKDKKNKYSKGKNNEDEE